eukprot:jgi/Psemu1/291441/fgenesh1_pg.699_\
MEEMEFLMKKKPETNRGYTMRDVITDTTGEEKQKQGFSGILNLGIDQLPKLDKDVIKGGIMKAIQKSVLVEKGKILQEFSNLLNLAADQSLNADMINGGLKKAIQGGITKAIQKDTLLQKGKILQEFITVLNLGANQLLNADLRKGRLEKAIK